MQDIILYREESGLKVSEGRNIDSKKEAIARTMEKADVHWECDNGAMKIWEGPAIQGLTQITPLFII